LIWLGVNAIRTQSGAGIVTAADGTKPKGKQFASGFRDGFLCNALNPKAALFFLSIFSQFLTPETPAWVRWIYGLENVAAVGLWFTFLAQVIALNRFQRLYRDYVQWFNVLLGCALIYFAGRIMISVL
jgi:threonine/homoserine/homoserine lactone efflux protein